MWTEQKDIIDTEIQVIFCVHLSRPVLTAAHCTVATCKCRAVSQDSYNVL
jgi:hypothetical protein